MIPSNMDGLSMGDELLEMHMDYQSPIEITISDAYTRLLNKIEKDTMDAVAYYKIKVDKGELLKALAYDRQQYRKGFADGYRAARKDLVRCRDCEYWQHEFENVGLCTADVPDIESVERSDNDFCCYAERKYV